MNFSLRLRVYASVLAQLGLATRLASNRSIHVESNQAIKQAGGSWLDFKIWVFPSKIFAEGTETISKNTN